MNSAGDPCKQMVSDILHEQHTDRDIKEFDICIVITIEKLSFLEMLSKQERSMHMGPLLRKTLTPSLAPKLLSLYYYYYNETVTLKMFQNQRPI